MLVLQAVLGAFAAGAAHAAPTLDAFGNPLCITHAPADDQPSPAGSPQLPDCCTVACSMVAPATDPGATANGLANPLTLAVPAPAAEIPAPADALQPAHEPGNPRAPPAIT